MGFWVALGCSNDGQSAPQNSAKSGWHKCSTDLGKFKNQDLENVEFWSDLDTWGCSRFGNLRFWSDLGVLNYLEFRLLG